MQRSFSKASSPNSQPLASTELPSRPLVGLQRESPQHSWTGAAATACTRAAHSSFSNRNCGIFPLTPHFGTCSFKIAVAPEFFFQEGLSPMQCHPSERGPTLSGDTVLLGGGHTEASPMAKHRVSRGGGISLGLRIFYIKSWKQSS